MKHIRSRSSVVARASGTSLPAGVQRTSLQGRTILITGSGRGIGLNAALMLARMGATVHLTDMQENQIHNAVAHILDVWPQADVRPAPPLDLSAQANVAQFAVEFLHACPQLDVLVNNAGANFMGIDPWHTNQGVAGLPQVNIVGPVNLTMRLLPRLLESPSPRIVNVASIMHRHAAIPSPEDFLRDWWVGGSYRNCKLVLVALSLLIQRELAATPLRVLCADPGAVYSGLWSTSKTLGRPPLSWILQALFAPPEDACATVVHAAAAPSAQPGDYFARGLFASPLVVSAVSEPLSGALSCLDWPVRQATQGLLFSDIKAVPASPDAQDLDAARELWDAVADLAGIPRGFKHLLGQDAPAAQPVDYGRSHFH